jgi:metal-responsive CopG/Arc/MetJ family transcriptional regulator
MPIDAYEVELEEIEVDLPKELLDDIDDYAVENGYQSPSDVVRAALE